MVLKIGSYLDEVGHIASILGYMGTMMGGKELPADAPEKGLNNIKGFSGFFGLKDEKTWLSLMVRLKNHKEVGNDTIGEECHAWVSKYVAWQERQCDALSTHISKQGAQTIRMLWKNRFRNMLLDLPSSGGSKTGTKKEVRKDGDTTTTTTTDLVGSGSSDALNFLVLMGKTIKQEFEAAPASFSRTKKEERAFERTTNFMRNHLMPVVPKPEDIPNLVAAGNTIKDKLRDTELVEIIKTLPANTGGWINTKHAEMVAERKKRPFTGWLDKIL